MISAYLAAVLVLGLLAATPGPDVAVVTRYALSGGRGPATRTAVGVVLGLTAWGAATVVGLAALLAASADAFAVVRVAGAAFLVALGVMALWRSRRAPSEQAAPSPPPAGERPLRAGLFTNLLNPKIAVFYTSMLPTLVPRGASAALWLPLLVATHAALSLGWLSGYAAVFSRSRDVLARPRVRRRLEQATGAVLIALGVRVAVSR